MTSTMTGRLLPSIEKKTHGTYENRMKSTDDDKADLGGAFAMSRKGTYRVVKICILKQRTAVLSFQRIFKRGQYSTAEQCDIGYRQANNGSNSTNGGK